MIRIVLKESKYEIKSLRETVGQHFDFDGNKREILTFIEKAMKGGNPASVKHESEIFYDLITNSSQIRTGASLKSGFTADAVEAWKKYFGSKPNQLSEKTEFYTDGVWTQYSVNRNTFPKKTEKGRTYNFYITIKKDKKNIVEFVNNFWRFGVAMEQLSDHLKTPIAYKTHSLLDSMCTHNDSLKIYFYDAVHADVIADTVKKLVMQMGVEVMSRTHEVGVDKRTQEEGVWEKGRGSFGQIASSILADRFQDLIVSHGTKYTPEQYFEWLKTHFETLLKSIKPSLKEASAKPLKRRF